MAERRMFSKRVISSARFLKMPISSQALYFHLGLNADDDGIVEAYTVIAGVGCTEDDLRVLVAKGFVKILNDDLVSYITDWNENNRIRPDRKIDSIYRDLLVSVDPDVKLIEKRERADVKKRRMDGQWTTNGQPMDSIGKDRLGKDSLGEDRLGKDSLGENTPADAGRAPKHKHGEYQHVLLTDDEVNRLMDEYGEAETTAAIKYLDEYIEMKGCKYKNHNLVLRKWVFDAVKEKQKKKPERELTLKERLDMA